MEIIVTNSNNHNNSTNWIWQKYATTSGKVFERYKVNNSAWTAWKSPATTDHPNLANSGWLTLSTGVEYKKIGDVVYVNLYKLPIKKNTDFSIGTLPVGYRPRKEIMKTSATWVVIAETVNIQIETDGVMTVLGPSIAYDRDLTDQISFAI